MARMRRLKIAFAHQPELFASFQKHALKTGSKLPKFANDNIGLKIEEWHFVRDENSICFDIDGFKVVPIHIDERNLHILENDEHAFRFAGILFVNMIYDRCELTDIERYININANDIFLDWINWDEQDNLRAQAFEKGLLLEKMKYPDDKLPGENAPEFLDRVYGRAIELQGLTLSELRTIDQKLWRGLRNWAHNAKMNLDEIIDRGKSTPGPVRMDDEDMVQFIMSLDPDDPRDQLAAKALRQQQQARERARNFRKRRSANSSQP